ncbi:MAG: hypothetical protein P8Q50_13245 [Octadecabacter sp.]|jgi:hypothetical protein|nr:hypothetical protein [Octadecabacter sp.]
MSNDALKDIQQALNIIRTATEKEEYTTKVKAVELITQSLLSHLQALEPVSLVKNLAKPKVKTPPPMPIPKSLNTPSSANNPNAVVPNQPNSQQNTANDKEQLNY